MRTPRPAWLWNGLLTGTIGAAATIAVIAAVGKTKTSSPWTPFNAIAHMLLGDRAAKTDGFTPRETLTGLGLHASALTTWGILYEAVAGRTPLPRSLLSGAAASGVIYLLDYHLFPPKLRPGFEKRLGNGAVFAAYAVLAMVFGLSPLWKRNRKVSGTPESGNTV